MRNINIIIGLDKIDDGKKIRYKKNKEEIIKYINYSKREDLTITTNDLDVITKDLFNIGCNFIVTGKISEYLKDNHDRYVLVCRDDNNNPIIEWVIGERKLIANINIFEYNHNMAIRILKDMYNFKNEVKIK